MRKIEFRAKNINDQWRYGYLERQDLLYDENYDCSSSIQIETLGQYTGLKDKNGTKIFEGDIIAYTNNQATVYEIGKKMKGFIFYDVECFGGWISKNNFQKHCDWIYADDIEVIGNIYDNKELLEENK